MKEKWVTSGKVVVMANVYGHSEFGEKTTLWKSSLERMENSDIVGWCIIGEFNEMRVVGERKGRTLYHAAQIPGGLRIL